VRSCAQSLTSTGRSDICTDEDKGRDIRSPFSKGRIYPIHGLDDSSNNIEYQSMEMFTREDGVVNDKGRSVQAPDGQLSTYPLRGPRMRKGYENVREEREILDIPSPLYACSFQIQLLSTKWFLCGLQGREWLRGLRKKKEKRDKGSPLDARTAVRYKHKTLCLRIKCLRDNRVISGHSRPACYWALWLTSSFHFVR
jgi:hypothetical protein